MVARIHRRDGEVQDRHSRRTDAMSVGGATTRCAAACGRRDVRLLQSRRGGGARPRGRRAPAVLAQGGAGEPAAPARRRPRRRQRHRRGGRMARRGAGPSARSASASTRVLMPDSSGMPLLGDLAAMRDAMVRLGGDPKRLNPSVPVDFIVDHSVMVDAYARSGRGRPQPGARDASATPSATRFCAGAHRRSTTCASFRRAPASATRSTSNTWRGWCGRREGRRPDARLSRFGARHGQPHGDDQQPRHPRLGRGRTRRRRRRARRAGRRCSFPKSWAAG